MKVKTSDAANFTTSEDILNQRGSLVLPKGILLTAPLIRALLKQEITEINVEMDEEIKKNTSLDKNRAYTAMKEHIDQLFIRHRGPFMKEFQQCLIEHLKKSS